MVVPPSGKIGRLVLATGLAGSFALAAGSVHADETIDRPATWDMALEELQAIGLGQYRGDPVPVPPDAQMERDPSDPVHAKQGVLFVNFEGAQLSSGSDNSKTNTTQIGNLAGSFAAYGQGSKRDAVMQAVRDDWAPFNVIVTDTRPASGDYTMNMTGPTNPYGGGVLGIAPLDCNDSQTHNNITYAFHSANDQFSASTQATTIGQEVAHSYGLEHVDEPGDIMNPYNAGGDPSFRDTCIQIVQGGNCSSQHAAQCGSGTQQNSYRELLALFGASEPDTQSPVVEITAPQDGDVFDAGTDFDITVTANDDQGIQELLLFNNGEQIDSDISEPYGWDVVNVPEGTYEFYVEAHDLSGNVSMSNVVTVTVGDAPQGGSDSGGDGGGGTDGGGSASGGSADGGGTGGADGGGVLDDGGDGSLPPGFGQNRGADSGCGCRADDVRDSGRGYMWMLAMVGLGLLRRRRSA